MLYNLLHPILQPQVSAIYHSLKVWTYFGKPEMNRLEIEPHSITDGKGRPVTFYHEEPDGESFILRIPYEDDILRIRFDNACVFCSAPLSTKLDAFHKT